MRAVLVEAVSLWAWVVLPAWTCAAEDERARVGVLPAFWRPLAWSFWRLSGRHFG